MKKDPKHITGERWRIKFQSSDDLEKHGNTEKSSVEELRDLGKDWYTERKNISVNEIRKVIQELLKETMDNPNKQYIILGKSGPVTTYYVSSDTQGERMVQWGQSMAK